MNRTTFFGLVHLTLFLILATSATAAATTNSIDTAATELTTTSTKIDSIDAAESSIIPTNEANLPSELSSPVKKEGHEDNSITAGFDNEPNMDGATTTHDNDAPSNDNNSKTTHPAALNSSLLQIQSNTRRMVSIATNAIAERSRNPFSSISFTTAWKGSSSFSSSALFVFLGFGMMVLAAVSLVERFRSRRRRDRLVLEATEEEWVVLDGKVASCDEHEDEEARAGEKVDTIHPCESSNTTSKVETDVYPAICVKTHPCERDVEIGDNDESHAIESNVGMGRSHCENVQSECASVSPTTDDLTASSGECNDCDNDDDVECVHSCLQFVTGTPQKQQQQKEEDSNDENKSIVASPGCNQIQRNAVSSLATTTTNATTGTTLDDRISTQTSECFLHEAQTNHDISTKPSECALHKAQTNHDCEKLDNLYCGDSDVATIHPLEEGIHRYSANDAIPTLHPQTCGVYTQLGSEVKEEEKYYSERGYFVLSPSIIFYSVLFGAIAVSTGVFMLRKMWTSTTNVDIPEL